MIVLSSLSSSQLPVYRWMAVNDKLVHFAEYLIFGYLLINALETKTGINYYIPVAIMITVLFPVLDEFVQSFVPGRFPEVLDAVVDIIGGSTGILIYRLVGNVNIFKN